MTRKEWMKEHYPEAVRDDLAGGVLGCPCDYSLLLLIDKSIPITRQCLYPSKECNKIRETCTKCWNHEIEEVTQ